MSVLLVIATAVRALANIAPIVIREGHGDRVSRALDTLATLSERGDEAVDDLKALTAKLQEIHGVDRTEKERLWAELENTHAAIQAAAASIPKVPPPPPPPPPAGGNAGSGGSFDANGSPVPGPEGANTGAGDGAGGAPGGAGSGEQQPIK